MEHRTAQNIHRSIRSARQKLQQDQPDNEDEDAAPGHLAPPKVHLKNIKSNSEAAGRNFKRPPQPARPDHHHQSVAEI